MRENKTKISVVAHNLFRFNFFFSLKGLRAGVWKRRDISTGGINPTNINFANIGNQVIFIDTIKYFQQSLGMLASNSTDGEKFAIRTECEKFIKKMKIFLRNLIRAQKKTKNGYLLTCQLARKCQKIRKIDKNQ